MAGHVEIVLSVYFFQTETGNEPVRQWLKGLDARDRRTIGGDIKTVQIGWPLGMPLVRKMGKDLWEVRIHLSRRIARVIFTVADGDMVLLHGFIKKSQSTPQEDLDIAKERLKLVKKA
jgi:phage-related protein